MLHIDIPSRAGLRDLASLRTPACVSIYLTTGTLPEHAEQARIALGNLWKEADDQLRAAGIPRADVEALQELIEDLIEDRPFWSYQSETLAIFASPEHLYTFRVPSRLPQQVNVSDRFLVKPLVRAVTFPHAAFILALSQNEVRLIEVTAAEGGYPVTVTDLPTSAADFVGKTSISGRSASGRIQGSEGQKVRMRQFSRAVDAALRPILHSLDVPLILATTQPLDGIYRSVNSYPLLAAESIAGNPEERSDIDLTERARPILDAIYAQQLTDLTEEIEARRSNGTTATDLSDVARAVTFGAVDTLLFDLDSVVPGTIDDAGVITFAEADDADNYGIIDEIVRRGLATGATVVAVRESDLADASPVVATLRYAI